MSASRITIDQNFFMSRSGSPGIFPGKRYGESASIRATMEETRSGVGRRRGTCSRLHLFRVMRGLCPNPSIEIKILPLGLEHLAHSGSCQQLESNGIGRADIWLVLQYPD